MTLDEKPPLGRFLKIVEGLRTTKDGYFGIKIQPQQLGYIFKVDGAKPSIPVFYKCLLPTIA